MKISSVLFLLFLIPFLIGCGSVSNCKSVEESQTLKGPRKIYVPEYYVYRKGEYTFVKGHYRWVLSPQLYRKRSLKGYGYKPGESAAIR